MAKRRKPGSGSVHLRKDGRWEGRCVVGYDQRGYPRTKNCLAKTKGECLRKLKVLREQCRPPEQPKEIESGMTFGAWLDHCWPSSGTTWTWGPVSCASADRFPGCVGS